MRRSHTLCFVLSLLLLQAYGQTDVSKLVPATPTTAALGKYGDIPVSTHTGIPNISVPLATLSGKNLNLNVELSYHAGGFKVEEMASSVGLGWSLFAGGVVTRQIRGLPDEDAGFIFNVNDNADFADNFASNVQASLSGIADFEPDIFSFQLGNASGKFVYDDESDQFVTITRSLVRIKFLSVNGWQITGPDGTNYFFTKRETNGTVNTCHPETLRTGFVTAWYLSKIVNADKTDSITFGYENYAYSYKTIVATERYFATVGSEDCSAVIPDDPHFTCYRDNDFVGVRLKSIQARSGKIIFLKDSLHERIDLQNDYRLKVINVYNERNQLLYSYTLNHDYFGPGNGDTPDKYRLRLLNIDKVSGTETQTYRKFEYYSDDFPSRLSFAQDYWGYFNGKNANISFVPTVVLQTSLGPLMVTGADRMPTGDSTLTHKGMLKKITYPTTGYTTFEYESHRVSNSFIPTVIPQKIFFDRTIGPGPVYSRTFTINQPKSPVNGNTPGGGVFASFLVDGITCDYGQTTGQATYDCAIISLTGPVGFTITGPVANHYLPNGTYTLSVDVSHNVFDPVTWEDFYVEASWLETDQTNRDNAIVGGLRIKKIVDHDPVSGKVVNRKIFKYHIDGDTLVSSAKFDSLPSFTQNVWLRKEFPCPPGMPCTLVRQCKLWKITSNANYPVTGFNGSVNYNFVTVYSDEEGFNGKTTYEYQNTPDPVVSNYPFLPEETFEWKRGLLLNEKVYSYNGASMHRLVRATRHTYTELPGMIATAIRVYPAHLGDEIRYLGGTSTIFGNGDYQVGTYYVDYGKYISEDSVITRVYQPTGTFFETIQTSTISPAHLNIVKSTQINSDGVLTINRMKYAADYAGLASDRAGTAINLLKQRNMGSTLIEKSSWQKTSATDSILVGASLTLYRQLGTKVVADKQYSIGHGMPFATSAFSSGIFNFSAGYQQDLSFKVYDSIGNPTEALAKNGIRSSLIWNNEKTNVVASVTNASVTDIYYNGFEDSGTDFSSALTGTKVLNTGSYSIPMSFSPTAANMKMSYWYWNGTQWIFSGELAFNRNITSAGSKLDELRVYPQGAQMTTYNYNPGVGVTHVADTNNRITRYEYDGFGRLIVIRDHDRNVLKTMDYHYATDASAQPQN